MVRGRKMKTCSKKADLDYSRVTRVSVWLSSLARIYPPQHSTRRLALFLMAIFSGLAVFSILACVLGCPGSEWGLRLRYDRCFTFQTLRHLSQYEQITAFIVACKPLFVLGSTLG